MTATNISSVYLIFASGFLFAALIYNFTKTEIAVINKRESPINFMTGKDDQLAKHHMTYATKRIEKITNNVHVAIGYGIANMIMIQGTDGVIVVDTMETQEVAIEAFKDYRKLCDKPLKGIIITHFHGDHIFGAEGLIKEFSRSAVKINLYMHQTTLQLHRDLYVNIPRNFRQFGVFIRPQSKIQLSAGVGPKLMMSRSIHMVPSPTHVYEKNATFSLAGLKFDLIHTPGETDDQTSVWFPEIGVLMPGDNIYEAFPNLYTIRGSPPRNAKTWFKSLDKIRLLNADVMIPSHTRSVIGREEIYDVITNYRDAIQFVHDQTLRLANKNYVVDDIVEMVKLPKSLSSHPFIQEYYGTVEWSIRSVYEGVLGWFDGDPVNLHSLSRSKRTQKLLEYLDTRHDASMTSLGHMITEARKILAACSEVMENHGKVEINNIQWALELVTMALEGAKKREPKLIELAKKTKIQALNAMAVLSSSANGRNYFLSSAQELEFSFEIRLGPQAKKAFAKRLNIDTFMELYTLGVAPEKCDDRFSLAVEIELTDVSKTYWFTMRHCVLEFQSIFNMVSRSMDVKISLSSTLWREIVLGERQLPEAVKAGEINITGDLNSLIKFSEVQEPYFF